MKRKMLALGCAMLAVLMLSAVLSPADARRGSHSYSKSYGPQFHGRFSGGPRHHIGPRFHGGPYVYRHYRRHRHIYVYPPVLYGTYYYSECGWLRRRALRTGSPYWWSRYHACIDADY